MKKQGSIGRRIESCLSDYERNDFESSFIHLFPAIDKTAKKRYPKKGVGDRIKTFLKDNETIIQFIATSSVITFIAEGISFEDALYKFGRTSIMHEGELDNRLVIHNKQYISIGETWELPKSYICSLALSVVLAPENHDDYFINRYRINTPIGELILNSLWGKSEEISERIKQALNN